MWVPVLFETGVDETIARNYPQCLEIVKKFVRQTPLGENDRLPTACKHFTMQLKERAHIKVDRNNYNYVRKTCEKFEKECIVLLRRKYPDTEFVLLVARFFSDLGHPIN